MAHDAMYMACTAGGVCAAMHCTVLLELELDLECIMLNLHFVDGRQLDRSLECRNVVVACSHALPWLVTLELQEYVPLSKHQDARTMFLSGCNGLPNTPPCSPPAS